MAQPTLPKLDVWSCINSSRATNITSLKSLQRFVLSLNKQELRQLISTYVQTKLSLNYNPNGILKQSNEQILKSQSPHINTIDQRILSKMRNIYQNKCKSKIISKMQQKNDYKHLLSIPAQLLSYSFQYLSYSENCKLSKVCLYFLYTNKQYNGLSNYYIKLDQSFWFKATRNRININDLIQFKHIEINYIYNNHEYDATLTVHKPNKETRLCRYILHQIIDQSKHTLDTLTINTTNNPFTYGAKLKPFNILLYITDNFTNLPLNKLNLSRDVFETSLHSNIVADIWTKIESNINNTFPQLTHFKCEDYSQENYHLNKYLILPVLNRFGCNLKELELHYLNDNILQLLVQNKLPNIKKLSLISIDDVSNISNAKFVPQIQELHVSFGGYNNKNTLSQLVSSFVGLNKFVYTHKNNRNIRMRSFDNILPNQQLNWRELFGLLCRKKTIYGMNNNFVSPLKYIQFNNITCEKAKVILKDILYLKDERYFDLSHFGMDIQSAKSPLINLIQTDLIPFMNSLNGLKSLYFSFAQWKERYDNNYMDPFMDLLSNIPKGVNSIKITAPKYCWLNPWETDGWKALSQETKNKKEGSAKFVSELCKISLNQADGSQLKSICLNEFKLTKKSRDYLIFFFGYNDKIFVNDNQYCVYFN